EKGGVRFQTSAHVGVNVPVETLRRDFDALVLAGGACWPRDLTIPGRELVGIHFAMEYLTLQNKRCEGDQIPDERFISAAGKRVVIIGGGDTGADCLGTVHRQGAASVHQFELLPRPPDQRAADNPWPLWPNIFRVSGAHEEGGDRRGSLSRPGSRSLPDGQVGASHSAINSEPSPPFRNLPPGLRLRGQSPRSNRVTRLQPALAYRRGSPTRAHQGSATKRIATQPTKVIHRPNLSISPAETWPRS